MSTRTMTIIRRILALDGLLLFFAVSVLASPALAQGLGEILSASSKAADQAAAISQSTDGVLKLALWAVILLVILIGALVSYLLHWVSRVSTSLDRLSSRPCVISREGLEEFMRREHAKSLIR